VAVTESEGSITQEIMVPDRDRSHQTVEDWLEAFSRFVRERAYEPATLLFDDDVLGFGSVTPLCEGIRSLRREQWELIWPVTSGFELDPSATRVEVSGNFAWVGAVWSSLGHRVGQPTFRRVGRATFVLRRHHTGGWRAVHSHFSLAPSPAGINRSAGLPAGD
jgi:ketosteroid isomerase-like protein